MIESLLGLLIFGFLILTILGIVFLIPIWVTASTESENNPNHIYKIFWEEAGYRGHKVLSASGCLLPFIALARPTFEFEGFIFCSVVAVICVNYHASVYRNYKVLTTKMKVAGSIILGLLIGASLLAKYELLPHFLLVFLLVLVGTAWGGFAVYRRSQLIHKARLSK